MGRGHGGTAIYWSKDIKASTFSNCDGSIIGLRVSLANSDLCLVNVYLPYCCPNNTDDFLEYLGKIKSLCDDLQCPNICFMGDFNASPNNSFGALLENFCIENDLLVSDHMILPVTSFTFVSDAHSSTSWLDHIVSSFSVHQAMCDVKVLHNYILSDHRPLAVNIQCSHLTHFDDDDGVICHPGRIDWAHASQKEREAYYLESQRLLDLLQLPSKAAHCKNFQCADQEHLEEMDIFYAKLTNVLITAAATTIPANNGKTLCKNNVPGWNSVVRFKHQIARAAFLMWVNHNLSLIHI